MFISNVTSIMYVFNTCFLHEVNIHVKIDLCASFFDASA